uniref:Nidogen 2a (osteonidogen) n=1 Tax=Scophthalmus maximus TaxID=52904 RepID=A0A8D3E7C2_SCOMX
SPPPPPALCTMQPGDVLAVCLLCWSCGVRVAAAVHRTDLFPYGTLSGDSVLAEGDDETSRVLSLPRPFYFYSSLFAQLYVATNGIISAQDLPMEKQYVDDGFPTDFPVVAPFLADIDTSGGRGQIYYRVTETPSVLNRVAQVVHRGFPDAKFTPTHAVVATWENVAAYEEQSRTSGPSNKVNTFQAVIGYDETDSYVLFLYPEGGLNFFGTRPKESYNVEIELPARVGFSRGEITYLIFSRTEGPHFSVTGDQETVKNLNQVGNTGIPGIWLFHTGNRYSFDNIVPASIGGLLATSPTGRLPLVNLSSESTVVEIQCAENSSESWFVLLGHHHPGPDNQPEEDDYPLTGGDPEFQPAPAGGDHAEAPRPAGPDAPFHPEEPGRSESYGNEDVPLTSEPRYGVEPAARQYAPPHSPEAREEGGANCGLSLLSIPYSRFQQQCSQNSFCSDYATGYCCHCRPGFYGNGRHCLPEGAPQRVSGKVSGTVTVGSTPVSLNNIDLHAYIVVGDGRAYTAISEVPEPVGWALMPVAPIGELFGWLFALELPNSQAGFKTTGAEFTRRAEITFYPGNERLSISQTARGLDDNNHLTVDTVVSGSVPFLPPGAEVTMDPFKETYQYYPSVATSSSVREFSVVSAERGSESFSFQLKQNITYRDCRHDNRAAAPETLQITMERVFVMYVKEERILRYAITNKISPVGVEPTGPELVNPCYAGNHDCDTTAQCIPLEGQAFQCQCATGYRGDGRNCYDVDECAESSSSCGAHAQCVNLPGSHRCQCQSGYEFGYDGRTCVGKHSCRGEGKAARRGGWNDTYVDECSSSPCHVNARCINRLGSFQCQCQPGFDGDGFYCSEQEGESRFGPKSQCEQHRDSLQSGLDVSVGAFIPQCDSDGRYRPLQCHGSTGHCWCVDSRGQERAGTRTPPGTAPRDCDRPDEPERPKTQCEHHRDGVQTTSQEGYPLLGVYVPQCDANGQYSPLQCDGSTGSCWCVDRRGQERAGTRTKPGAPSVDCLPSVAPPTMRPLPRPDVTPPTNAGVTLLYAQGQKIGALPLNGTRLDGTGSKTLLTLHGSIVVGIGYDCKENQVYWTDLSARTINRASLVPGAEPEILINTNLVSPEGLAVDVKRRLIFWVDSTPDVIESANLDGSGRQTLFDTDLVNPRAIIVVSSAGTLYWTDWNREAPKIECASVDGQNRRVVVSDGIGLPNALTFDSSSGQVCWADAGTKRLECISPDGSGRRVIHPTLNYPFSMVYYRGHFYYTDWRRDGVIVVSKDSSQFTDEYLPDQRSHLYGIAIATTDCLSGETGVRLELIILKVAPLCAV